MESRNQVQICLVFLKNGLESRGYNQYQVYPRVFYIKESPILICIDDCVIVSNSQETITSLIEYLKNGPENYVLTDEEDISNCIGVSINKNKRENSNYHNCICWIK